MLTLLLVGAIIIVGYILLRIYVVNGPRTPSEFLPQNLKNKNIVITGASNGIGRFTAIELFKKQARVILACRNEEKTKQMIRDILNECKNVKNCGTLEFVKLNLDDLESVKDCSVEILKKVDHVDVLINNAGSLSGDIKYNSKYECEEMVFSNAIAHHLLIELLWSNMENNPNGSRIVVVASNAHQFVSENDFYQSSTKTHSMKQYYGLSKLCNIYQTFHFHEERISKSKHANITINCCHPGAIRTGLMSSNQMPLVFKIVFSLIELLFFKNVEQGSQNTLHLACSSSVNGISGQYFHDCHIAQPSSLTFNKQLQNEFISITNEIIKPYLQ
ncbi:predicted protein [Naegleria gruberi]|uniref:Predicted protein n=1 Tax=Naegleria gruberi TaxID=5762 RepID=D2V164_NAEGR|nr:uncharacterized protein NAEGRDRAFT_30359 [Naegleria gruberi]EFC49413.1 predicted protein [Naegleria gruberi]|eukprot:XP_002682157.1 predicted protein [Naegleria gruberi strain NEG-M]